MKYNKDRYNPFSNLPEDEFNIITTYLSTTLLDIYRQWVADKKKMSLNRLIEIASTLTANGFYGMINQP